MVDISVTEMDGQYMATGFVANVSSSATRAAKADAVRACADAIRKRSDIPRPLLIRYPFLGRTFDIPWWDRGSPPRGTLIPANQQPRADEEHKMPEGHAVDGDDGPVAVPVDETMRDGTPEASIRAREDAEDQQALVERKDEPVRPWREVRP